MNLPRTDYTDWLLNEAQQDYAFEREARLVRCCLHSELFTPARIRRLVGAVVSLASRMDAHFMT